MNTLFVPFFLFSFLASAIFAQTNPLTINSLTNVDACEPSLITWTGGKSPYILAPDLITTLAQLGQQNGTSFSWTVNLAIGTTAFLQIRDSDGQIGQSAKFTVAAGTTTSCINSTATVVGGATSTTNPTSVGSASGSTGPTTPTSGSGTPSSVPTTKGTSTTRSGATSSPSTAAAATHYVPFETLAMTGAAALVFAFAL